MPVLTLSSPKVVTKTPVLMNWIDYAAPTSAPLSSGLTGNVNAGTLYTLIQPSVQPASGKYYFELNLYGQECVLDSRDANNKMLFYTYINQYQVKDKMFGYAVDIDALKIYVYSNNGIVGTLSLAAGTKKIAFRTRFSVTPVCTFTANFGDSPFVNNIPSGYLKLEV